VYAANQWRCVPAPVASPGNLVSEYGSAILSPIYRDLFVAAYGFGRPLWIFSRPNTFLGLGMQRQSAIRHFARSLPTYFVVGNFLS